MIVRRSLPEVTAGVVGRIAHGCDGVIPNVHEVPLDPILWEGRGQGRFWGPAVREAGEPILHYVSHRDVGNRYPQIRGDRAGTIVEESVQDILPVQRRWDTELVGVRLVLVRPIEIVSIALKAQIRDDKRGAGEWIGIAPFAVIPWWIEDIGDILSYIGPNRREYLLQYSREIIALRRVGRHKLEALVGIVTDHDADVAIKVARQQQLSRQGGCKCAIHNWAVEEAAIEGFGTNLIRIPSDQLRRRQAACLLDRTDIQNIQKLLQRVLLLRRRDYGIPPRALNDCLLERSRTSFASVGCDLMHDGTCSG